MNQPPPAPKHSTRYSETYEPQSQRETDGFNTALAPALAAELQQPAPRAPVVTVPLEGGACSHLAPLSMPCLRKSSQEVLSFQILQGTLLSALLKGVYCFQ